MPLVPIARASPRFTPSYTISQQRTTAQFLFVSLPLVGASLDLRLMLHVENSMTRSKSPKNQAISLSTAHLSCGYTYQCEGSACLCPSSWLFGGHGRNLHPAVLETGIPFLPWNTIPACTRSCTTVHPVFSDRITIIQTSRPIFFLNLRLESDRLSTYEMRWLSRCWSISFKLLST